MLRLPFAPKTLLAGIAATVAVAGCGSTEAEPGEQTGQEQVGSAPESGIVTTVAPQGPRDPAENLKALMMDSNPEFGEIGVDCTPVASPPEYPFECTFTARDRKQRSVSGTITVEGVYTPTMTYAFSMEYGIE